ncbi:EP1-like glycoprotein 1 [Musa acuminata AAA Group]|uniref:EP1-like glycoprotein 1 n=1 Tax=Musa acuminata AAA Group TaxID=214697 RepID=UPI0031CF826A
MVGQSLRVGGNAFDGNLGKYNLIMESLGLALYINGVTTNPLPYYYYSDGMFGIAERLTHPPIVFPGADGNLATGTGAWETTFAFFSNEIETLSACALPSRYDDFGVCENEMCVAYPSRKGLRGWSRSCAGPKLGDCSKDVDYYEEGRGTVELQE